MPNTSTGLRASLDARSVADALRSYAMSLGCPVGYLERQRVATVERHGDEQRVVRTFVRDGAGLVSVPSGEEELGLELAEV